MQSSIIQTIKNAVLDTIKPERKTRKKVADLSPGMLNEIASVNRANGFRTPPTTPAERRARKKAWKNRPRGTPFRHSTEKYSANSPVTKDGARVDKMKFTEHTKVIEDRRRQGTITDRGHAVRKIRCKYAKDKLSTGLRLMNKHAREGSDMTVVRNRPITKADVDRAVEVA